MPKAKAVARVGISGWTFPAWRGSFYPDDLPQRRELEYASRQLNTIEINGTFYSLQKPATFQKWHAETPADFVFAVKAPQFMTHVLRLKEAFEPLATFFASGLLCLGRKLGPILWQFPPNVKLKDDRFDVFLKQLPFTSAAAEKLARRHGPKVKDRAWVEAIEKHPVRHAFEFRHASFTNPDFLAQLKAYGVAFVVAHEKEGAPYLETPTADFVYARLHGEGKKYAKGYPPKAIGEWATRVQQWTREGRDSFVFFSNDAKKYSPDGAQKLISLLAGNPN